ncbi:MAG: amidohydrolase family protein, partial [Pseudomonadota bacterium]
MYDLLIKNGVVVDGSGGARYRADVAVSGGRIARIGRINEQARQTLDAEGHVVTPGFVDGHTHMDAQIFWDPIGSCSCYHGVTTAVMGNCGFTLAPCPADQADFVFRNLERAEDLSRDAMLTGIDWQWETFPQFLDVIDGLPKGINYAGYIGHSALRTYVMGERAFSEQASEEDLKEMCRQVVEAVGKGAVGFSTSRTFNHITADDRPVASRIANWDEVRAIVNAMGETGKGIFEIAGEAPGRDPERIREYHERLRDLAVESGVPQTWGMFSVRVAPELWRPYFELLDETAAAGGRMFAQTHSRALNVLLSFKAHTPFDKWEYWSEIRALPIEEQKAKLADPAVKAKLVEIASREYTGPKVVGAEARPPQWEWVYPMAEVRYDQPSMAELAAQ